MNSTNASTPTMPANGTENKEDLLHIKKFDKKYLILSNDLKYDAKNEKQQYKLFLKSQPQFVSPWIEVNGAGIPSMTGRYPAKSQYARCKIGISLMNPATEPDKYFVEFSAKNKLFLEEIKNKVLKLKDGNELGNISDNKFLSLWECCDFVRIPDQDDLTIKHHEPRMEFFFKLPKRNMIKNVEKKEVKTTTEKVEEKKNENDEGIIEVIVNECESTKKGATLTEAKVMVDGKIKPITTIEELSHLVTYKSYVRFVFEPYHVAISMVKNKKNKFTITIKYTIIRIDVVPTTKKDIQSIKNQNLDDVFEDDNNTTIITAKKETIKIAEEVKKEEPKKDEKKGAEEDDSDDDEEESDEDSESEDEKKKPKKK